MIKMGDGFFIPKLDGFDDIQKDTILVNIDLTDEEHSNLSYKELKGIAIMEKYTEKLKDRIDFSGDISEIQEEFRKQNNIKSLSLDTVLES
jgi:hypothetical protein